MKLSKIKIFFDYRIFFLQKYGGISRYFNELSNYIENSAIVAPININHYLKNNKKSISFLNLKKIPRYTVKIIEKINDYSTDYYIDKIKPSITHLTYFQNKMKIKKRGAIIITVYDLIHEKFYESYGHTKMKKIKQNYIDNADFIICISENTQKDLIDIYDVDPSKTSVIYLGTNENLIKNESSLELDNKYIHNRYILFVGDRKRYKNFDLLLNAYANSRILKENFNLVCSGGGNFNKEEIKKILSLKLNFEKVINIQASDNELTNLYKNSSVFVFPSKYEGFGLPALEAMRNKCPTMLSDTQVFKEIFKNNTIYFDQNHFEDLKIKLEKLLFDEITKKKMILDAYEFSKKLSWENCAVQTKKIYEKFI